MPLLELCQPAGVPRASLSVLTAASGASSDPRSINSQEMTARTRRDSDDVIASESHCPCAPLAPAPMPCTSSCLLVHFLEERLEGQNNSGQTVHSRAARRVFASLNSPVRGGLCSRGGCRGAPTAYSGVTAGHTGSARQHTMSGTTLAGHYGLKSAGGALVSPYWVAKDLKGAELDAALTAKVKEYITSLGGSKFIRKVRCAG